MRVLHNVNRFGRASALAAGHTHRVLVLVVLHVNTVDLAQNRELVARVRQLVQQPLDEVRELGTPMACRWG